MLRDFRTVDGEKLLEAIAKEHTLTSTTLAHIKVFLSAIFRFAKRKGVTNSENPIRDVVLPRGIACRRDPCLFTRRDHANAERAAGTSRDDRRYRGIHRSTQRRTARAPLGELRR
jgi:hypothetical protein